MIFTTVLNTFKPSSLTPLARDERQKKRCCVLYVCAKLTNSVNYYRHKMIKFLVDFIDILEISAKVQDCRFQLIQNTLKQASLESHQKVANGQPPVKNAEHTL